jgi:hypothetical protein
MGAMKTTDLNKWTMVAAMAWALAAPGAFAAQDKAAAAPAADSMDVVISGDALDEIPLSKPAPSVDIPFDQVATLSREGQTDRVLDSPVEHMSGRDQMSLLRVESRQTFLGLPVRIPSPPLLRMEVSPGLSPEKWELQILDQDDKIIRALEGTALPRYVVDWDGFQGGRFILHPGPAYTPVLILTDEQKRTQRLFGEPVQFAVFQYLQDGRLHIEFDNNRLFERGRPGFSSDMVPYLAATLNILRQRVGKPMQVTIHAPAGTSAPVQQRLENLKAFYVDGLALEKDMITFAVQPAKDRGDITEILASEQ